MTRTQHGGCMGERFCMPFDAGYISYCIMVALGVSCGMEGCYMERPEMRLRFAEVKPWCMMMLSDQTTLICHTLRGQAAQKPLGIGTKLFNKATALRSVESFRDNTAQVRRPCAVARL